jgi:uncharacterized protein YcbX
MPSTTQLEIGSVVSLWRYPRQIHDGRGAERHRRNTDSSEIVLTRSWWRFEVRRFRPNIVVEAASGEKSFVENAWIGHTICIGDGIRLNVSGPAPAAW